MTKQRIKSLFDNSVAILTKHGYQDLVKGFDEELVHILLNNHIEKVKHADSYDKALQLINQVFHSQYGMHINLADFINDTNDKQQLYNNFRDWRSLLIGH
jgi:FlaA1/EpsC-like NDP-sugar epimerase